MSEQFRTGGSKIIENPVQNGDIVFRVNKGGVKTDVLSISGTNGTISSPSQPPVGAIVAYNPGYYTSGSNAGFTLVGPSTNNAAGVNAYLPTDWRVCDGTALNDSASPIWNAASRFLPNLTDSRFLMGSTSAGTTGGSNTIDHTHNVTVTVPSHYHGKGTLAITGTSTSSHSHTTTAAFSDTDWSAGTRRVRSGSNTTSFTDTSNSIILVNDSGAHTHGNADFSGAVGATASGRDGDAGFSASGTTSGSASNTENRPLYLSTFYIVRVK